MTFYPTVELAPGADLTAQPSMWSWTDVTSYVFGQTQIRITRGRTDRSASTVPDKCELTLLNPAGIWVPDNPTGPYWGLIDQNTPLRVLNRSLTNNGSDAFNRTSSSAWDNADVGGAWTTAGGAGSDYSVAAASGGRHLHTAAATRHTCRLAASIVRSDQTVSIRVNALSTGAAQSAGLVFRRTAATDFCRGELQFATSGAITGRIVQTVASVDTVNASVASALTHSTSTWYRLRVQVMLTEVRLKVWVAGTTEPVTWLIDGANGGSVSVTAAGTGGPTSIRETGNTNANATFDFDDYTLVDGPVARFCGHVEAWPTTWADTSETQSYAPITATGRLRLLGQAKNLKSALYRAMTAESWSGTPLAVGYWPMEDVRGATQFASGLTGGPAMTYSDMSPAADSTILGSDPLPTGGDAAYFTAVVPTYTATNEWAVRATMKFPALPSVNTAVLAWTTSGTIDKWALVITTGSTWTIQGYTAGVEVLGAGFQNFIDADGGSLLGRQIFLEANAVVSGGNVAYSVYLWSDNISGALSVTGSVAASIGIVTKIFHSAYPGLTAGGYTIGHVGVALDNSWAGNAWLLAKGFAGETTSARLGRLGAEENVAVYFGELGGAGPGTTTQTVGAQRTASLIGQFREVEATEEGVLFDGLQGHVTLLPRQQRQNHAVNLTLDRSLGQLGFPFEPVRDDFLLHNDVAAANVNGSTARAQDVAGIRRWGVYSDSITINVQDDTEVVQHAGWRLNLGKTPQLRYPAVLPNLTGKTSLLDSWLGCDIGSRIQLLNLLNTYDPADLLIEGYAEVMDLFEWRAAIVTSPARPWSTFTIQGGGNAGRLNTAGSTLVSAVGTGTLHSSTFETGVSGWTPTSATFVQSATHAHAGTYGGLLTVTGTPVQAYVRAEAPVTVGVTYGATVWVYSVAGYGSVQSAIDWYDSGHAYLSTTAGTTTALAAGTWERRNVIGTAPASAAYGQYGPTLTGSPGTGTAVWVDDTSFATALSVATTTGPVWRDGAVDFDIGIAGERITVFQVSGTTSPQTFGVVRSVNGVSKAQAAAAPVSLWRPGVFAL